MPVEFSNIFDVLFKRAGQVPSKDALLFSCDGVYRSITYETLLKKTVGFGRFLSRKKGIRSGDRVVVLLENRPEFAWVAFGVLSVGGILVPLDTQYDSGMISRLVDHSQAVVIISTAKYQSLHGKSIAVPWVAVDAMEFPAGEFEASGDGNRETPVDSPKQLAAFFYTSGTTAEPRAVMLTHRNLLANVCSIQKTGIIRPSDVVVSILPLHHTYAFTVTLLCPLLTGMTIAYPKSLASSDLLDCMKQTCATVFVGVPQIFAMIHRAVREQIARMGSGAEVAAGAAARVGSWVRRAGGLNLAVRIFYRIHRRFGRSLRLMVSGGARLDPVIAKDFYQWGFTLVEGYGLTETSPVVSLTSPDRLKFGSVGKAVPGVEIRIYHPDSTGAGEVIVRGDNVMQGYYQMEHETHRILRDGWFYTGDLGRIDGEGFLFLTGRKKEMLVLSNGENVNPEELEMFYGQNPFIKEIAVLTTADEKKKVDLTRLVAVIVPDEDYFRQQKELHIRKRLRWELENYSVRLPIYKRIRGFVISQEGLPRTRLGKLRRFELERIYEQLEVGMTRDADLIEPGTVYSEFSQSVIKFFEKSLGKTVSPSDHLELDLGLDSLDRLELLTGLQKSLGLKVADGQADEIFSCTTVGQIMEKIRTFASTDSDVVSGSGKASLPLSEMAQSAFEYLRDYVGRRDICLSDHLELDLGLDSLSRVELLLGIQEHLDLSLSDDDALSFFLCASIADLVRELDRVTDGAHPEEKGKSVGADWRSLLSESPDESLLKHIYTGPVNILWKAVSLILFGILRLIMLLCFRIKGHGLNNLPRTGPVILCANHATYLDGVFVAASLPFSTVMQTFFLGDSKFLDSLFLKAFQKIFRLIPIQFTHRMVDAMRVCTYVLRKNKILCYFPEGQRSIDGGLQEFRKGIGILVKELDVPVVPVYIRGAFDVWPRGQRWPKAGKVKVFFGPPVSAQELMFRMTGAEDVYARIAENLREKIGGLAEKTT